MHRVSLLVASVTIVAATARAHVAPSIDDNNRYLKITPQADRVRLAYTVFFGEVPGRMLSPGLDTDRDGAISDAEAQAHGDQLAREVGRALELAVDGKQQPVQWKAVSAGMGTPMVTAGAFSVDMIAYVCFAEPRGKHRVHVRDRFRVPKPGETEVLIDAGQGISIAHARMGGAIPVDNTFKLVGPGGPLADDGLDVAFTASADAPLSGACGPEPGKRRPWLWVALVAAIAVASGVLIYKRRK